MAISEYADSMGRELSSADVLAIMSACYEAVLNSERIPRVTVEIACQVAGLAGAEPEAGPAGAEGVPVWHSAGWNSAAPG
jgi:hypothetical protein